MGSPDISGRGSAGRKEDLGSGGSKGQSEDDSALFIHQQ